MSRRYQAGFISAGYNPLRVPNAPTIGTATAGTSGCASVAFTAPACIGGSAITSYTAVSNCGAKFASGASSPVLVKCLTVGTAYTFRVFATNSYGPSVSSSASNSVTPAAVGQQAYTTAGTYSWVVPAGVTSVSVVTVGGGGGGARLCNSASKDSGGGGGGALAYANNLSVTPGATMTVVVGSGGAAGPACGTGVTGGFSSFADGGTTLARANGGTGGQQGPNAAGGTVATGTGGAGGVGLGGSGAGGGGAGGYSGAGGASGYASKGSNGAGGGGGGGGSSGTQTISCIQYRRGGSGGGGVGILGSGSSGAGGNGNNTGVGSCGGGGGSGGANGCSASTSISGAAGGGYGGGGGSGGYTYNNGTGVFGFGSGAAGAGGAVRIIWPGTTRQFPSTCTGDK